MLDKKLNTSNNFSESMILRETMNYRPTGIERNLYASRVWKGKC